MRSNGTDSVSCGFTHTPLGREGDWCGEGSDSTPGEKFTDLFSDRVNKSCVKILLCADPCNKETETGRDQ